MTRAVEDSGPGIAKHEVGKGSIFSFEVEVLASERNSSGIIHLNWRFNTRRTADVGGIMPVDYSKNSSLRYGQLRFLLLALKQC